MSKAQQEALARRIERIDPSYTKDEKRIWYGRYSGQNWKHIPSDYLRNMVNERMPDIDKAERELKRRGTLVSDDMFVTSHAIDRVSQTCLDIWEKKRRGKSEGLHTWLHRVANEAYPQSVDEKAFYMGMVFVFVKKPLNKILVTVIRDHKKF